MKKTIALIIFSIAIFSLSAQQQKDSTKAESRILIIPYQSMMYFSDADQDIARFSRSNEMKVRNEMRNNVEANIHHQLLSCFDAISLMRSTSLNGEPDLNRIYGATQYTLHSNHPINKNIIGDKDKSAQQKLFEKFKHKTKDQTFWVNDSNVMLGMIGDPDLFQYLSKKYNEKYILFLTQFEVNTNNKNTIEWSKQQYKREYILHYNLFDKGGNLILAQTLTIKGENENSTKEINDKYLVLLGSKLKEIIQLNDH